MFDEPFRKRFVVVAAPLVAWLASSGVTPNQVTVSAFVIALFGAGFVAAGWALTGLGLWLASRLGDGLDGALARATGRKTAFGGYLDITLDMAAYSAMVLAFSRLYPAASAAWLAVLAGYVLVITSTLALSETSAAAGRRVSTTDRTYQFTPGVAEAGETTVMYCLWVAFPVYVEPLAWIWVAALAVTGLQRTWLAWHLLRETR